jgi:L,D-peptidoglycan transpeptidase YkuD (ErfK/YbiS/YcfS/YnhG family)
MTQTRGLLLAMLVAQACAGAAQTPAPVASSVPVPSASGGSDEVQQLVVVTTPAWDSISGTMQRFTRLRSSSKWRADGAPVRVVVGRTGLAWGADTLGRGSRDPRKREGDGRAPAGMFPLDTAFGFAPASAASWVRLPYVELRDGTECVDDSASVHYNTVVDRGAVPTVDWTSAEPMRRIEQYRLGVIVGYNASPTRRGRGSCIFLHIWAGPTTPTAGCTAFPATEVESLVRWLDPRLRPMLVQLPAAEYARLRERWQLP